MAYADHDPAPSHLRDAWRALRREGVGYVAGVTALWLTLPLWRAVFRLRRRGFVFQGQRYAYFLHRYNLTLRSERAVEVALVWPRVCAAREQRVLEVGHVLGHYFPIRHDVVDRYERGPRVENVDVVDLEPAAPYDLVVSISTLEHIGWDETPRDPTKVARAVERLAGLLARPGGKLLATFPVGYNPYLDDLVARGGSPFSRLTFLRRTGLTSWEEASWEAVRSCRYGAPRAFANAIAVAEIEH